MSGTKPSIDMGKAKQELTKTNFLFISKYTFFGYIMAGSNKIINPNIQAVAGMNIGKCLNIYFHPEYFSLTQEVQTFVTLHEIGHFVFKHPWRAKEFLERGFNWQYLNYCMDLAINSWLRDSCGVPDPHYGVWPEHVGLDKEKSFDWYVYKLRDKILDLAKDGKLGIGGDGGAHDWVVDVPEHEAEGLARRMYQTAEKAAGDARLGILRDFYTVKAWAEWQDAFKTVCQSSEVSDESIFTKRKFSRRFHQPPGTKHDYKGEIHVFVDCSGSMSDDEIGQCFSIIGQLALLGYDIWIHEFDAGGTCAPYIYKKVPPHVHGGGGTILRPALEECKERFPNCVEAVVLTDAGIGDLQGERPLGFKRIHFAVTHQGHRHMDHLPDWGGKHVKIEVTTN